MPNRMPRNVIAVLAAGALVAGAGIAASAHTLSGLTRFDDESASSPRVEQPEPSESPEADEVPVVVVTPSPEPTETPEPAETPEANNEEANEAPEAQQHEQENENRKLPVVIQPTSPQRETDEHDGGHDD